MKITVKNDSVCPICKEGNLEAKVGTNKVEYKGQTKTLPMHFSECDCCGSEQALPADLRQNKRLMAEAKKDSQATQERYEESWMDKALRSYHS